MNLYGKFILQGENLMNTLEKLKMELKSLSLVLDNLPLSIEGIQNKKLTHEKLTSIEMFARRAKQALEDAEKEGLIEKTKRITDKIVSEDNSEKTHVVGDKIQVNFPLFNKTIIGKADTGATTSSLHATNITVKQQTSTRSVKVSFMCKELSPNVIIADVVGMQQVVSADNENKHESRYVVAFDVEINGKLIKNAEFNLNDRSHMDVPILIGQNILSKGNFVVDVNHKNEIKENVDFSVNIEDTISNLIQQNISFKDIYDVLKRKAIKEITY
jgi:hypothetical protein